MSMIETVPLDATHAECLTARDVLRRAFAVAHDKVAVWSPTTAPARPTRRSVVSGG